MTEHTPTPADDLEGIDRAVKRGGLLIALGADKGEDGLTQLSDVLADLMHWADRHDVDWDEVLAKAERSRDDELEEWGAVQVEIENTYEDGHSSTRTIWIEGPEEGVDVDDWFTDVVFEYTGDEHGIGRPDLGSCYTAEVVNAFDPALIGKEYEWLD